MAVSTTTMTLDEFLQLPEDEPALEYEDGMVSQKVSPKAKHSRLQGAFAEHINWLSVQRKLAMAFPELRTSFGGRSYVPDVAVFQWDRIPVEPDGMLSDSVDEPPDIAVEIVSLEHNVMALFRKCVWYIEHGVKIALLVDPYDQSVMVFRSGQQVKVLDGGESIALGDVLPGFALTVRELFDSLRIR